MIGRRPSGDWLLELKFLWPLMSLLGILLIVVALNIGLDMVQAESPYIKAEENIWSVFKALLNQRVGIGRHGPSGLLILGLIITFLPPVSAFIIRKWDLI